MKLFVWDFHGVLERGNEAVVVDITNAVLAQQGYAARITAEQVAAHYGRPWYEYFQILLPGETLSRCKGLAKLAVKYQRQHPDSVAVHIVPAAGALEVLAAVAAAGNDQIVISSVAKQDLKMFVRAVGYEKFFPEGKYLSAYSFWRGYRSKTAILLEYLKKSGKNYDKVVIIGDSKKDIMDLPGAVTYLYAHPWKEFKDVQTDYKIHDLREVLKEV